MLTYRILGDSPELQHTSQKSVSLPQGVAGGKPGDGGRWIINESLAGEHRLPSRHRRHRAAARGDTVTHYTPGGGGYGDPMRRDPLAVARDVRLGFVTSQAALRDYGVRVDPATLEVAELVR